MSVAWSLCSKLVNYREFFLMLFMNITAIVYLLDLAAKLLIVHESLASITDIIDTSNLRKFPYFVDTRGLADIT